MEKDIEIKIGETLNKIARLKSELKGNSSQISTISEEELREKIGSVDMQPQISIKGVKKGVGHYVKQMVYWVQAGKEDAISGSARAITASVVNAMRKTIRDVKMMTGSACNKIRKSSNGLATQVVNGSKGTGHSIMTQEAMVEQSLDELVKTTILAIDKKDEGNNVHMALEGEHGLDWMRKETSKGVSDMVNQTAQSTTLFLRQTRQIEDWLKRKISKLCKSISADTIVFAYDMMGKPATDEEEEKPGIFQQAIQRAEEDGQEEAIPWLLSNLRTNLQTLFDKTQENLRLATDAIILAKKNAMLCYYDLSSDSSANLSIVANVVLSTMTQSTGEVGSKLLDALANVVDEIQVDKQEEETPREIRPMLRAAVQKKAGDENLQQRGFFSDAWAGIKNIFSGNKDDEEEEDDGGVSSSPSNWWGEEPEKEDEKEEEEEPSLFDKIKKSIQDGIDKAKDAAKTAWDKVKDFLGLGDDEADDTSEPEEEEEDEEPWKPWWSWPSSLDDDPDWANDPDIQDWLNEDPDDFLDDPDDFDEDDDYDPDDFIPDWLRPYYDEDEPEDDYPSPYDYPYDDPDSPFYDPFYDPDDPYSPYDPYGMYPDEEEPEDNPDQPDDSTTPVTPI